jgi:hypothetical protein
VDEKDNQGIVEDAGMKQRFLVNTRKRSMMKYTQTTNVVIKTFLFTLFGTLFIVYLSGHVSEDYKNRNKYAAVSKVPPEKRLRKVLLRHFKEGDFGWVSNKNVTITRDGTFWFDPNVYSDDTMSDNCPLKISYKKGIYEALVPSNYNFYTKGFAEQGFWYCDKVTISSYTVEDFKRGVGIDE